MMLVWTTGKLNLTSYTLFLYETNKIAENVIEEGIVV